VITTFVFWGFDYLFNSIPMRYLGAVIGLSIGYIIKYQLDKKFVFAGVQKL
jgi:putative flippase GtrA